MDDHDRVYGADDDQHVDDQPHADDGEEFEDDAALDSRQGDEVEELRTLVGYLAANLVDEPDDVEVSADRRGGSVHLSLRVPEGEIGKVIGRQGRIARAMRTVVGIAASRHNLRASLDIEG